jgi:beta-phosphoglucomutase-like phosphatase (HAD superfamily)
MEAESGLQLNYRKALTCQITAFMEWKHLVRSIDPVVAVAHAYHGCVPLAVASSGSRCLVSAILEAIGVAGLFDAVITADDVRRNKPAPDVYLTACERLSVCPQDCIAYEDTDDGIRAASTAGMRVIDVRPALESR